MAVREMLFAVRGKPRNARSVKLVGDDVRRLCRRRREEAL